MTEKTAPQKPKEPPKKQGRDKRKPLLFTLSSKEKVFFARHLSILLKAGIPLLETLNALHEQAHTKSLRHVLKICIADVESGQPLAHALETFPRIFDPFFANVVSVGEQSGTLANSLEYLATQLEKSREIQAKVRAALFYPIIVTIGAFGIGGYLAFFLLPNLLPVFTSLDVKIPATTRFLLAVTDWLRVYWPFALGGLAAVVVAFVIAWRIRKVRKTIHHLFILTPAFGKIVQQIQNTQFALILGTLLTAGVKIVPALGITANSIRNLVYADYLKEVAEAVEKGETIGEQLKKKKRLFSITTASMIEVGEKTGKLAESLLALASFVEKEVDRAMNSISSLIGPLVLIIIGILVGFIALSIITPLYQLTQSVSF